MKNYTEVLVLFNENDVIEITEKLVRAQLSFTATRGHQVFGAGPLNFQYTLRIPRRQFPGITTNRVLSDVQTVVEKFRALGGIVTWGVEIRDEPRGL